jgi:hypothetical protein
MSHADVEATIRKAGGNLLKDVVLFDVYRGNRLRLDTRVWLTPSPIKRMNAHSKTKM